MFSRLTILTHSWRFNLKIGYFITNFPYKIEMQGREHIHYHCGGAQVAAYHLALEMAKRAHCIEAFTTSFDSNDSIEKYGDTFTVYHYGTNFKVSTSNISFNLFLKPLSHNVNVIHTHFDIAPNPLAGLKYSRLKKIPLIVTYHGDWDISFGGRIRRLGVALSNKFLVDRLLSHADRIISPSKYYINESKYLKKYKEKAVVIPNGINIHEFNNISTKVMCREQLGLPIDKNVVLFLSFLSPYKGPDILLKAMVSVVKYIPNTELIIVGRGAMENELKDLSVRLNINKNVKFIGFVDEKTKKCYYKAADIFCLPSTMNTDVFPLVLLEASASGLPLIVSNLPTFKCIIKDGYNGIFAKKDDYRDLANNIIHLLENPEIRLKMGLNSLKIAEMHSWEKIAKETEVVYNDVVS